MGQSYRVSSPAELERLVKTHVQRKQANFEAGIQRAIRNGTRIVAANAPVAFGNLKRSVEATPHGIEIVAPHAGSVETGSRPHLADLDALIAWVKLRGMQGVHNTGEGPTTAGHAHVVSEQIRNMGRRGATPVNAPERIARAIQRAILEHGTLPTWFVRGSLPALAADLDICMKQAGSQSVD